MSFLTKILFEEFLIWASGLDVRDILRMRPSHAFMKLIMFGIWLPYLSTGVR